MSDIPRNELGLLALPLLQRQSTRQLLAFTGLRPWLMRAVLLASDVSAIVTAGALTLAGWGFWRPELQATSYLSLWPFLCVFLAAYAAAGLYQGSELNPVQELKRATISTSLCFTTLALVSFLLKESESYSRASFLLTWSQTLFYAPIFRNLVRAQFAAKSWWGHAAVIIGAGSTGARIVQSLQKYPEFGLKPVAVLDDRDVAHVHGIPVAGGIEMAPVMARSGVRYAIIAQPELTRQELLDVFSKNSDVYAHMLLVPDLLGVSSLWVETADLGGILSLRIRQQLLLPGSRLIKAALDRGLAAVMCVGLLPLIALLAALIKISSPGPAFYSQQRIGRRGRKIQVWKFRSMVLDADRVLHDYLSANPQLKQEWESDRKLRRDPRITPIGKLLRRTSLDELPQLWNVIKGEMSLVGPRPIVDQEISKYGSAYDLYRRVTPGITGLWQVSGRNDVTYNERVSLDVYYARNWSVWLDLHILARTVRVVLFRQGAY